MNRKEQAMFDSMIRPRPTAQPARPVHKLGTQRDTWRSTAIRLSEKVRELHMEIEEMKKEAQEEGE